MLCDVTCFNCTDWCTAQCLEESRFVNIWSLSSILWLHELILILQFCNNSPSVQPCKSYPTRRFVRAAGQNFCVCFLKWSHQWSAKLSDKISWSYAWIFRIFWSLVFFLSWISEKRRSPGMSLWRHPACQHESDSELRRCSSDSAMRKGWFTGEAAHGSSDYTIQKGNWKGKVIIFPCLLFNFIHPLWISATKYPEI